MSRDDIAYARCSCGNKMKAGSYLCDACLVRTTTRREPMRIIAKARFKRLPGNTNMQTCGPCPMLEECKSCAGDGRVLACERADMLDAMGSRLSLDCCSRRLEC
jgi:hypothetical protein